MTDNEVAAPSAPPALEPPPSYGARLSWERQRAGLTVTDIAARLRLHPNQVRAIEQENLAALPELAYVRGFIRSYARLVQVDAGTLLADLNSRVDPASGSVVDGMASDSDYSPVKAAAREQTSKRVVIGLAVVALIALGIIGWYANQRASEPVVQAPPPAPAPVAAPAEPVAAAPATVEQQQAAAEVAPPAEPDVAVLSPPAVVPALRIRFSGASWLQVADSKGNVLVSGLQQAGAEHEVDGSLPITVVIGDAGKASVEVRGEPFNLVPVTRSNVARFNVE